MRRLASRRFDFTPSRAIRAFVVVSHASSIALVAAMPLGLPLVAGLALLVAALGVRTWRGLGSGLAGMVVRSDGSVAGLGADGRALPGALREGSVALPLLATIAWRADGERRTRKVPVAFDALTPEAHREVRVFLRYATSGRDDSPPSSQARASISAALSALVCPARR